MFDPNRPPHKPCSFLPEKTVKRNKAIDEYSNLSTYSFIPIPEGTKKIQVSNVNDYHGEVTFDIQFYGEEIEQPNSLYEIQLERYNKEEEAYKKSLEEWNEQKKIYDAKKVIEDELAEKALLAKLKKKYPQLAEA